MKDRDSSNDGTMIVDFLVKFVHMKSLDAMQSKILSYQLEMHGHNLFVVHRWSQSVLWSGGLLITDYKNGRRGKNN